MSKASADNVELGARKFWGVLTVGASVLLALSLFSYDWRDVSLMRTPVNAPPCNLIGVVGAWVSYVLLMVFGIAAYVIPFCWPLLGIALISSKKKRVWPKLIWTLLILISLALSLELSRQWWISLSGSLNISDCGGIVGHLVTRQFLVRWLSTTGAGIIIGTLFVVALIMLLEPGRCLAGLRTVTTGVWTATRYLFKAAVSLPVRPPAVDEPATAALPPEPEPDPEPEPEPEAAEAIPPPPRKRKKRKKRAAAPSADTVPSEPTLANIQLGAAATAEGYELPPISLLNDIPEGDDEEDGYVDTETISALLVKTLADFGIEATSAGAMRGPVVTRYEIRPAPGIRVERIVGLQNNLALSLKATSVRVQAPVPGKDVVGIEVPNPKAEVVYLREMLESSTLQRKRIHIPLYLGKDVGGKELIADLSRMPHLLIAGATGAGKTVCMNAILAGLLMKRTPEQLRLMLVDPKIVEFSGYNNLPHLVVPVVTDPKKVALALRWAINEMEKRYKMFNRAGVRNIESFNSRVVATQEELFDQGASASAEAEGDLPATVPYIVIVIDELADLMLEAGADIENAVARLAQLSRAVGIHMILSTQRPSVNVITGTIKANFPARIAFQVAQKVDSRTILDATGADKLLGRGDMLFLPPATSKLVRAQGAMVEDEEIHRIVEFIKGQAEPSYEADIHAKIERPTSTIDSGEDDELLTQAIEIIRETRRASTSSLQRRMRIGYTRAARIMDILEERGLVGPTRGAEPREILIDLDGEIPDNPVIEEYQDEDEETNEDDEDFDEDFDEETDDDLIEDDDDA